MFAQASTRIAALLPPGAPVPDGARQVDASGCIVTAGFIDLHAHLEPLLEMPLMESARRQGVTFALGGPDGGSPLPLKPYMDSVRTAKPGINVGYLVGHNDVRRAVLGMAARAPNDAELARMKPTSTLTNIARGGIVDDAALIIALREGRIAAAGLDVFEGEPALNPGFLGLKNVVLTPHIASSTVATRLAMAHLAADNLIGYLTEGKARTPLNPEVLGMPR
jgi:hypothetical protein